MSSMRSVQQRATALALLLAAMMVACSGTDISSPAAIRARIDKGEIGAAAVSLKAALQADPGSYELRALLGRMLLVQEQPVLAEVELRKALEDPRQRDVVLPMLAEAMLAARRGGKLIEEFGSVRLADPKADLVLQTVLADAQFQAGKIELGRAMLGEVLKRDAGLSRAVVLDTRQLAAAGDPQAAVSKLEAVIAREPNNVEALLLLADVRSVLDKEDTASLVLYRKALSLKKNSLAAHSAVITILLRRADFPAAETALADLRRVNPAHPQTRFLEAQTAFAKGDVKSARELVQLTLALAPGSASALQLAALIEMRAKAYQRAEAHLVKAVQLEVGGNAARRLLAENYVRAGLLDKAMVLLTPMLQSGQPNPMVLSLAAEVAMQRGDVARAGELYNAAAKALPEDRRIRTALAMVDLASGRADVGLRSLRELVDSRPDDIQPSMVLMSTLLQRGDHEGAIKVLDATQAKNPDAPGLDLIRGRIQLLMHDRVAARKSFEAAVAKHPKSFPGVAALATLDVGEQRPLDAIRRYEQFIQAGPSDSSRSIALRSLAGVKFSAKAPHDEVVRLLREAVTADPMSEPANVVLVDALLRSRQVEAAVSAGQAAVAKMPDSADLLDALGRAQMAAGELRQAAASFGKVLRLQPRSAKAHLRLGQIQQLSGDAKGAIAGYLRALAIDPELDEAQVGIARFASQRGQLQPVLTAVRALRREHAGEAFAYRIEGDVQLGRHAFDEAIAAYRLGVDKTRPGRLPVRLHRAYVSAGKTAEAQQFADTWAKQNPGDVGFIQHVADHAMSLKDYKAAEIYYRRLIERQPYHHMALNNLAWLLTRAKQPGAVAFAERAVRASPGQSAVLDTLAHALVSERQTERAVQVADDIMTREAGNAMFQLSMAKLYAEVGQPQKARDALAKLENGKVSEASKAEAAALRAKLDGS